MAITLSGGATIGQQGLGGVSKMSQKNRVQFDIAGTYVAGGKTGFAAFIKAITNLGSRITIVDIQAADVATNSGYVLAYHRATDTLRIYGTGAANKAALSELGAGDACDIANVEVIVEWV